jgi:hypothetical protein
MTTQIRHKHIDTVPELVCGECSKGPFSKEEFKDHILSEHPEMENTIFWADKIVWTMYPDVQCIYGDGFYHGA